MEEIAARLSTDNVTSLLRLGLIKLLRCGLATIEDMRLLMEIEGEMAAEGIGAVRAA